MPAEPLTDLHASFNRHLRADGVTPATLRVYAQGIGALLAYLGPDPTTEDLTRSAIVGWLDAQRAEGYAQSTIRTRYRGVHRFVSWLRDEPDMDVGDPMRGLRVPKAEPPAVPVLSDEDLAAILATCTPRTSGYNTRDEALLRVLLDVGCRVGELVGMEVDDVDLDAAVLRLRHTKGGRERYAYPSNRTVRALDRWLRMRRHHRHADLPALWLTQRGAMSPDAARDMVRARGEAVGIQGVHPHQFRHTAAHDLMLAGVAERDVMRLLGWRSSTMLDRYGASAAQVRTAAAARRASRGDRV